MSEPRPLAFAAADDGEELARAELYGLLSRLWLAPPDAALMRQIDLAVTDAPQPGGFLEEPWRALVGDWRQGGEAALVDEYDRLFLGVGKPELMLYGSFYLSGYLNERPLAQLRADLQDMGLARDASRLETEDHVAYLFEVMRYLIAGDDAAVCNLECQRVFFRRHLQPWIGRLCDAVQAHPGARHYAALAVLTRAFMSVDTQAFDLLEQA